MIPHFFPSPLPISNPSASLTVSTFQIYSKYSNHISPCLPVPPQPKTLSSLAWTVERVYQLVFSCLVLYCVFFTQHPESLLKHKIRTCCSNYKNCQVFSMILRMKLLTYRGIQDLPCSVSRISSLFILTGFPSSSHTGLFAVSLMNKIILPFESILFSQQTLRESLTHLITVCIKMPPPQRDFSCLLLSKIACFIIIFYALTLF